MDQNRQKKENRKKGEISLSDLMPGQERRISHCACGDPDFARKLVSMGFAEGTVVRRVGIRRNDPLVFCIRNVRISLRRREAAVVFVF